MARCDPGAETPEQALGRGHSRREVEEREARDARRRGELREHRVRREARARRARQLLIRIHDAAEAISLIPAGQFVAAVAAEVDGDIIATVARERKLGQHGGAAAQFIQLPDRLFEKRNDVFTMHRYLGVVAPKNEAVCFAKIASRLKLSSPSRVRYFKTGCVGARRPLRARQLASTALESMPPERNTPTGRSDPSCRDTIASSVPRIRSRHTLALCCSLYS